MERTRFLQHIRTLDREYVAVPLGEVPASASVAAAASVPSMESLRSMPAASEYISVGGTCYRLCPKTPQRGDLKDGEIAVSYSGGSERLFISNKSGEIVEFRPYRPSNAPGMCVLDNLSGEITKPSDTKAEWKIPASRVEAGGVNPALCFCAVRRNSDGAVVTAAVETGASGLKITFTNRQALGNIADGAFTAMVTGWPYKA